jgi:ABC-type multidrug transport system fused ATPase/permease subunit
MYVQNNYQIFFFHSNHVCSYSE